MSKNNFGILVGEITSPPKRIKDVGNKKQQFNVRMKRASGQTDEITVHIWKDLACDLRIGDKVKLLGEFHSKNIGETKVDLFFCAMDLIPMFNSVDENQIVIVGYLCKVGVLRRTPMDRVIVDFILAVHRDDGHSDYINCIAWGNCAKNIADMEIGTLLRCNGRMQSRIYIKDRRPAMAYEVSVDEYEVMKNERYQNQRNSH